MACKVDPDRQYYCTIILDKMHAFIWLPICVGRVKRLRNNIDGIITLWKYACIIAQYTISSRDSQCFSSLIFCNNIDSLGANAASWHKRLDASTAGVPSSRLGHSMWISWWTKRGPGRFFSGFLPFSPTTNFIPPFLHSHFIHFVSFHQPLWWCVRRGRPAPLLFTDLQYRGFLASHPLTQPCVGHELRIYLFYQYYYPIILCNNIVRLGAALWRYLYYY